MTKVKNIKNSRTVRVVMKIFFDCNMEELQVQSNFNLKYTEPIYFLEQHLNI